MTKRRPAVKPSCRTSARDAQAFFLLVGGRDDWRPRKPVFLPELREKLEAAERWAAGDGKREARRPPAGVDPKEEAALRALLEGRRPGRRRKCQIDLAADSPDPLPPRGPDPKEEPPSAD